MAHAEQIERTRCLGKFVSCYAAFILQLLNIQGPRAQMDRTLYKRAVQSALARTPNLTTLAASVHDLVLAPLSSSSSLTHQSVAGIRLDSGEVIECSEVVICTGTFLAGEIHIGSFSCLRTTR